ncbi:AraC family transcriptional regulator [Prevotella sp. 10(H)]|uniref:AraC family transcriptional regulator n=1 Tax=Prevotella sp. 10(H) TaxID=1158294 RepID=UPI0004A73F98|nr:AraC family transcriptional regulator [Prevotella sp. 10(H)]
MNKEVLYIKNMVCNRCIMVVESELKKLGVEPFSVELGEVQLESALTKEQKEQLTERLESLGFSLIDDRKGRLIEQVKTLIVELVHYNNNDLKINLSDYISEKLHHDYNYISNLFSEVEGTTIEKYFIAQKIEKVKELLVYDELTLNEIAFKLNYSSVAHLSAQFKKVTGLTPSHFKQVKTNKRKPLDKV